MIAYCVFLCIYTLNLRKELEKYFSFHNQSWVVGLETSFFFFGFSLCLQTKERRGRGHACVFPYPTDESIAKVESRCAHVNWPRLLSSTISAVCPQGRAPSPPHVLLTTSVDRGEGQHWLHRCVGQLHLQHWWIPGKTTAAVTSDFGLLLTQEVTCLPPSSSCGTSRHLLVWRTARWSDLGELT